VPELTRHAARVTRWDAGRLRLAIEHDGLQAAGRAQPADASAETPRLRVSRRVDSSIRQRHLDGSDTPPVPFAARHHTPQVIKGTT